jgi:hypothetical protein
MHAVFTREHLTNCTPIWRVALSAPNEDSSPAILVAYLYSPVGSPLPYLPNEEEVKVYRNSRSDGLLLIETNEGMLLASEDTRYVTVESLQKLSPPPRKVPEEMVASLFLDQEFTRFGLRVLFVDAVIQMGASIDAGTASSQSAILFTQSPLLWIGIFMLVLGWFHSKGYLRFLSDGTVTLAKLIGKQRKIRYVRGGHPQPYYEMTYAYTGPDGKGIQLKDDEIITDITESYPKTVALTYLPDNPECASVVGRRLSRLINGYVEHGEIKWNQKEKNGLLLFPVIVMIMQAIAIAIRM